jgi:hypothetical protein
MRIVAVALLTVIDIGGVCICTGWGGRRCLMVLSFHFLFCCFSHTNTRNHTYICIHINAKVTVLGKPLNKIQWFAIVLLTTGAVQYQLSGCSTDTLRTSGEGLFVMAIIITCAAGGNIITQVGCLLLLLCFMFLSSHEYMNFI